ncbi:MAG: hypothetical protein M1835_005825 [Candelina submexicana]|nr:MAG: hypothetical protein M1835_005825 [Candelina submexicana]
MTDERTFADSASFLAYPDIPIKKGTVASRIQAYNLVRDNPVILARRRSRALERLTTTLKQRTEALAARREPYQSTSTVFTNDDGRSSKHRPDSSPALTEHVRSGFGRRATKKFALPAERTSSYGFPRHSGNNADQAYGTSASGTSASDAAQLRGYFSRRLVDGPTSSKHQKGLDVIRSGHSTQDRAFGTHPNSPSHPASNSHTNISASISSPSHGYMKFPESQKRPTSDIEAVLGRQLDVGELKSMIDEVRRQHAHAATPDTTGSDADDLQLKQDLKLLRGSIAEIFERPTYELQGTDREDKRTRTRIGSVQRRFADTPLQQPSPLGSQDYFHLDKLLSRTSSPNLVPSVTAISVQEGPLQGAESNLPDLDSLSSSTLSTTKAHGKRRRRPRAGSEITGRTTSETRFPRSSPDTERCYGGLERRISTSPSPDRGVPSRGRQRRISRSKAIKRHSTVSPPHRPKRRRRRMPSSVTPVGTTVTKSPAKSEDIPEVAMLNNRYNPYEDTSTTHCRRTFSNNVELEHETYLHTAVASPGDRTSQPATPEQPDGIAFRSTRKPSVQSFASSQFSGKQAVGRPSWWKFGVASKRRQSETIERAQLSDRPRLTLADAEEEPSNTRSPEVVAISAISAKGTMTPSNACISRPQSLKSYSSTMALSRAQATVQAAESRLKHPLGERSAETERIRTSAIVDSEGGEPANNLGQALEEDRGSKNPESKPSVSVAPEHGQGSQVRIRGFSVVVNLDGRDDLIITAQLSRPNHTENTSSLPPRMTRAVPTEQEKDC